MKKYDWSFESSVGHAIMYGFSFDFHTGFAVIVNWNQNCRGKITHNKCDFTQKTLFSQWTGQNRIR